MGLDTSILPLYIIILTYCANQHFNVIAVNLINCYDTFYKESFSDQMMANMIENQLSLDLWKKFRTMHEKQTRFEFITIMSILV